MTRQAFTLDDRELHIVGGLIAGASTKEIAAQIGIDRPTLLNIIGRIRKRFAAASNEQLIAMLFRRGIQQ